MSGTQFCALEGLAFRVHVEIAEVFYLLLPARFLKFVKYAQNSNFEHDPVNFWLCISAICGSRSLTGMFLTKIRQLDLLWTIFHQSFYY